MKRRILTVLTALCMMAAPVCGAVSEVMQTAVTAHAELVAYGLYGENVTWTLDDAGTLTISGTGEMSGYSGSLFYEEKIKKVVIQPGVTSIGDRTFLGCTNLTSVTIPNSVTSIGERAFLSCTSLTSVTIPDSVTSIGDGAFEGCTSLTSVTIPDSVTSVNAGSFYKCTSLTAIKVSAGNSDFTSIGGILYSKDMKTLIAYPGGRKGAHTIPDSVTSIGESAFSGCTNLTSVTIPDSVTSIGRGGFCECTSLTSVTIPDSVTSIGEAAFLGCTNLTSVTILNPKCEIGDNIDTFCNVYDVLKCPFTGTIYGYSGSTAQAYAEKYGRTFVALDAESSAPQVEPYSTGDVTGDAVINAKDASAVLIAAAKLGTGNISGLSYEAGKAADINNDGSINAKDANSILRYAAAVGTGKAAKITDFI